MANRITNLSQRKAARIVDRVYNHVFPGYHR